MMEEGAIPIQFLKRAIIPVMLVVGAMVGFVTAEMGYLLVACIVSGTSGLAIPLQGLLSLF